MSDFSFSPVTLKLWSDGSLGQSDYKGVLTRGRKDKATYTNEFAFDTQDDLYSKSCVDDDAARFQGLKKHCTPDGGPIVARLGHVLKEQIKTMRANVVDLVATSDDFIHGRPVRMNTGSFDVSVQLTCNAETPSVLEYSSVYIPGGVVGDRYDRINFSATISGESGELAALVNIACGIAAVKELVEIFG